MCTRDCYRLFGYFLGFLWMASSVYYTTETIELLKLMKLRCDKMSTRTLDTPGTGPARLQFSDAMIGKVCDFYTHLDVFMPYHIITTIIKMMPGILLVTGIYTSGCAVQQVRYDRFSIPLPCDLRRLVDHANVITVSMIHGTNLDIRVQTPGRFASAQPIPHDMMPARK
uniref:Uncharacterized protein n=1 Tax=Anopheles maculatus TaxID=74869 RepID=A0A182SZ49_9DIPT